MNDLSIIIFAIAGFGILLLLILLGRIFALNTKSPFQRHRSTQSGLSDLLNYASIIEDGILVGKNGSLMSAWSYRGEDNASSTDEHRNSVSFRINQALSGLGSGWMFHIDAVRRPTEIYSDKGLSHFPDPVTEAIENERRQLFSGLGNMYDGYFILTITWFPPVLAQAKFVELMFDDDTKDPDKQDRTTALVEQFKREIANIESRLSAAFSVTRLKSRIVQDDDGNEVVFDELLSWLQYAVSGTHHDIRLPHNPMYLDSLVGGQELFGGVVPKIGRHFIQVVSIEGLPIESTPGILSALAELPGEYRWSSRFIFMDEHQAHKHLEKFRKKWRQKIRGFFDQVFNTASTAVNKDAVLMVDDAESAIADLSGGMVAFGFYTSVIVLMDEDREQLDASSRMVEKAVTRLGFAARIESINTLDAFFGSLPGHGVENVRRPLINTMNFADMIPTSSIWTGLSQAPCPMYPPLSPALMHCVTQGQTPFRLNLHVGDIGHTIMFGPTGGGKSTHLAILAAQLRRYSGMSIYSFDKGLSLYPLTKAVNGLHYSVAADDETLSFCPLQFLDSASDRAWAMEWVDSILILNGVETTPAQRNEIAHAIDSMRDSGAKTLSELSVTIQDEAIRAVLKQYTVDGAMGHLLDAEHDGLELSDFTTFEIDDLMSLGDKYALPVLLYLFRRIEKSLHGQPAAIILDEAWLLFAHDVFREKIREWLKVMRKANCLVLMATQSLSDAARSGILDVIMESTATKIFLPNIYARDEDASALYRRMGLNDRQIEILATAVPKKQYYYVSANGRRLYELAIGPLTLSFVGASDKDSINSIKELVATHGDKWVPQWLNSRGLSFEPNLREPSHV